MNTQKGSARKQGEDVTREQRNHVKQRNKGKMEPEDKQDSAAGGLTVHVTLFGIAGGSVRREIEKNKRTLFFFKKFKSGLHKRTRPGSDLI